MTTGSRGFPHRQSWLAFGTYYDFHPHPNPGFLFLPCSGPSPIANTPISKIQLFTFPDYFLGMFNSLLSFAP